MPRLLFALLLRLSLYACMAGLPIAANATGAATEHQRLVEQVWQAAHLSTLSEGMAGNLLTGIEQQPEIQSLGENKRKRLLSHYRRYSQPERFTRGLRRVLQNASDQQLRALLTLANSAVAQRALTQELAFRQVPMATMNAHAQQLLNTEEGRARAAAITRLDQAIGVTEMAVSVTATTLFGTTAAMRQSGIAARATSRGSLAKQVARFAVRARPWQAEQVKVTYLYLYRKLPLAELQAYVAMQEHWPVKSIQRSFVRALGEEMIAIQSDVIREVVKDMQGNGIRDA